MRSRQLSRSCSEKKRRRRKLCLEKLYFLYLFCAFLCPCENGALSVSSLERMAGTTRLELATSAVTVTSCNFTAPIATLGALRNPQEVLLHPYCTQIFGINSSPSRIISTESRLFGKVLLQDDTREQRRHFSGIQLRVDSKPSHSVYECSSADTQSDCSAIRTAYAALACGKRLYDFLALLPFVLLSAGVDIRS